MGEALFATCYAGSPDAFDADEIQLLQGLARRVDITAIVNAAVARAKPAGAKKPGGAKRRR